MAPSFGVILHVSDFHGREDWYAWLTRVACRYELVCVTGDLIGEERHTGPLSQRSGIVRFLRSCPTSVLICSGNHDAVLETDWTKTLRNAGAHVDVDSFAYLGVTFRCRGWGSHIPARRTDREIWLAHAPPSGTETSVTIDGTDFGDLDLEDACRSGHGPQIILSGHVHDARHWNDRIRGTVILNPGHASGSAVPSHIELDLGRRIARYHSPNSDDVVRLPRIDREKPADA
ncbi:calcineurin-like phosphoesterase superfamily domain protein [mine drainage metagenome]|uniref:Calcineurin-like phosphoesterase superfamily domain protein n=1 Tax=mine drainage metagenome TaxID=410659 RepID=A0A1J5QU38_9ZZZZ